VTAEQRELVGLVVELAVGEPLRAVDVERLLELVELAEAEGVDVLDLDVGDA
jgi:hypothetical protein